MSSFDPNANIDAQCEWRISVDVVDSRRLMDRRRTKAWLWAVRLIHADRVAVFHGNFLDPKTSTVFGVFLFVGSYMLGFLRAHKPRLSVELWTHFRDRALTSSTLLCVFGSIIMDCASTVLFSPCQRSSPQ